LDISLLIGVNSEQRCNLLKQCLSHICETGLRILTLTFDGLSSNLTMATLMGCQLNVSKDLKTFFPHPVTYNNVYIYIYIHKTYTSAPPFYINTKRCDLIYDASTSVFGGHNVSYEIK
jgi:hypothetical protein